MIKIDELSNEVLTDAEISSRVSAMIESVYPAGRELKIMRLYLANPADDAAKAAFNAYNAEVELIRADGVTARAKADLMRAAIDYEKSADAGITVAIEVQAIIDARVAARIVEPISDLMIVPLDSPV